MSENTAICPICGGPVPPTQGTRERVYCSQECKSRALYLRKKQRAEGVPKTPRSCPVCGEDITDLHGGRRYCSLDCSKIGEVRRQMKKRLAAKERRLKGECAPAKATEILRRKCHDCGRPTSDYRCPACLRAWRQKHGVPVDGEAGYGDAFAGGVIGFGA